MGWKECKIYKIHDFFFVMAIRPNIFIGQTRDRSATDCLGKISEFFNKVGMIREM